jgi:hypothetical protein
MHRFLLLSLLLVLGKISRSKGVLDAPLETEKYYFSFYMPVPDCNGRKEPFGLTSS